MLQMIGATIQTNYQNPDAKKAYKKEASINNERAVKTSVPGTASYRQRCKTHTMLDTTNCCGTARSLLSCCFACYLVWTQASEDLSSFTDLPRGFRFCASSPPCTSCAAL